MPNFSAYGNYGYAALKKQTTSAAVKPDIYFRLINESIVPAFNITPINEISGDRERMVNSVQGTVEIEGDIEIYVEENIIGHFLRSLFGAPTTQTVTSGAAYRHIFAVGDTPLNYTFDVAPGNAPWVHRFYNTQVTKIAFSQADNAIKATISVMPTKAFISARVTTAALSGNTLLVDQTAGLTTSDTILVLDKANGYTTKKELTISAINSSTSLGVSTIDTSLAVDDIVVIKRAARASVVYDQCQPFQFSNGTAVFTGDDIDNTSERITEDFSVEFANEVERHFGSGLDQEDRYPYDIVTKGYTATGSVQRFYDSDEYLDRLRANDRLAVRFFMQGMHEVTGNSATKARSNWGSGNGFYIEAATAGKAGNDYNVTFLINTTDTLAAALVPAGSKNIVVYLANTTAANNTGTLIAAAVDALTGVDAAAVGTGAETFTTAAANVRLGEKSSGTNVVGTDANQKPYLQIDFASGSIDSYFVNNQENEVAMEEIPLTFYKDVNCENDLQKGWSTRIYLYNGISSL